MAVTLNIKKKVRRPYIPDPGIVALLRDWDGEITVTFGPGATEVTFDPSTSTLHGGYVRVRNTFEAAGITFPPAH